MFNGFSNSTNKYFNDIMLNNNRQYFIENKLSYKLYVKKPLLELFYALLSTIMSILQGYRRGVKIAMFFTVDENNKAVGIL